MKRRCKPATYIFGKRQAVEASVAISFLLNIILILGLLFGQTKGILSGREVRWFIYFKYFLWHFLCNVILFYFLFLFNFKVIRSRLHTHKVQWIPSLGTILICFLLSPLLAQIQWYTFGLGERVAEDGFIIINLVKDMILAIIVMLVTRNIYSNYKREQTIIANQKLIEENIRVRFEALKNQLDPHFLFNSLNTLNGLIGFDNDKAHDYVDDLSAVFRYTLQNKNICTMDKELEFVESYMALLKIRYGDNLSVEYDIDNRYRSYLILPVSLQLLVENAVKHNVISNKYPLKIVIATTRQESVTVSNRMNPKAEPAISSGVGLANLTERYAILFSRNIVISDANGIFTVEIPLMKETDKSPIL